MKLLTLAFPVKDGRILLGMKRRGFGVGRWNGFGGKLHEGESPEQAAKRELTEEAQIDAQTMEEVGVLTIHYQHTGEDIEVHVFRVTDWAGFPIETEEMRPKWFAYNEIPYDDCWPDDRHWMPLFLKGKKFRGEFWFQGYNHIERYEVEEI